jgi:hypothetical protein
VGAGETGIATKRAGLGEALLRLVEAVAGLLIAGALLVVLQHFFGFYPDASAPIRWEASGVVFTLAWVDVAKLAHVASRPEVLLVAVLPVVLLAVLFAIARSGNPRWVRVALHAIAGFVFVFGSIALITFLKLQML